MGRAPPYSAKLDGDGVVLSSTPPRTRASDVARNFCVSKARCFHAVDRERLLGAIEAAYGDTAPFDEAVRSLLSTRKRLRSRRRLCMAHELQRRGLLP